MAFAAPGFGALGTMGLPQSPFATVDYGGWIAPRSAPTDVGLEHFTFQTPVYQTKTESVSLSTGASLLHFGQDSVLSGSGTVIPQNLSKLDLGGSYAKRLEEEKSYGFSLSVGSASDRPFSALDVTTIGASAFYSWSTSERSRWVLTLLFSNNNPIVDYAPIPGFIYIYQTPTFTGLFGLPFSSIRWAFADRWTWQFSFFGPVINTDLAYGHPGDVQPLIGFNWQFLSYLPANRYDPKARLTFEEKKAFAGARFPLFGKLKSDLQLGYAFDRKLYEGTHFLKKDGGEADFGASTYASWNLRLEL